jgi:carboxypeptidase Q
VKHGLACLALGACVASTQQAGTPAWVDDTGTLPLHDEDQSQARVANQIIAAARASRGAYAKLEELTTRIGNRVSGSPELERAVVWARDAMTRDGLANVHTEKVMVPHWVRGAEDAAIVAPVERPLVVLGLGETVPTPKAGVVAPVVVVHDWHELEANAAAVKGAIVLYDVAMPAWTVEHGSGYGDVVGYRTDGAVAAAKLGAVGMLMRSATAHSLRTPHTGAVRYDDKVPKIPAAAVTVEDAELLARLAAHGPVTVRMHLESQKLPDAESANVIGEVVGTEHPDELVVIGAHLDSWDVGQGAHDDGAGVAMMIDAARVLEAFHPRRTVRVVLFTNEEYGPSGGNAYAVAHAAELPKTVAAIESDSGGFSPRGFSIAHATAGTQVATRVQRLARPLAALGVTQFKLGGGGSDITPMKAAGVPLLGLDVDNRSYFDIHHTEADTLDKVDPVQLADAAAAVAAMAYLLAEQPGRVDR